ncbi:DUF397 domain-containing protein [Nocardiopsis sp. RV163]|uniref:DUF397 domain-containing protein n=1 Tax=Nocardiopsis sp. RV163 TaxID=1661388 RepID=UPI00064C0E88|nr:DUF397 domain-containing protein [Nocardiopsis sp. RV163]
MDQLPAQHEALFRTSTYSSASSNCVEVADTPAFSAVRDTQNRDLGTLTFGPAEWRAFLSTAKGGLS